MQTYNVEITETLSRMIEVQAINKDHARDIVERQYQDSEIVLDSNDNVDVQFNIIKDFNN